jgi:excisionase family DNA binding protein
MPSDTLLDHRELQHRLGCSRSTAYGLTASGALPVVRLGRAVRVPESALDAFIRSGGVRKIPRKVEANGNRARSVAKPAPRSRRKSPA